MKEEKHSYIKGLLHGIVWTSVHTKLTEHTGSQVVLILYQYFLFLACFFVGHRFAGNGDCIIGASHLAKSASNTFVITILINRHDKPSSETGRYF